MLKYLIKITAIVLLIVPAKSAGFDNQTEAKWVSLNERLNYLHERIDVLSAKMANITLEPKIITNVLAYGMDLIKLHSNKTSFDLFNEEISSLKANVDLLLTKSPENAAEENPSTNRDLQSYVANINKKTEEHYIELLKRKTDPIIGTPKNCKEATRASRQSGVYEIIVPEFNSTPFKVYCEEDIETGGWTVIQRRVHGYVDFNRNWEEYKAGFGDLQTEFFIGLDKLYALTNFGGKQELYIIMKSSSGYIKTAKYSSFAIGTEYERYYLKDLGTYRGNSSDALRNHVSKQFSTKDGFNQDTNCAEKYQTGWWFSDGRFNDCYTSLLNGLYNSTQGGGIEWKNFEPQNQYTRLEFVQMMIRPAVI